MAQQTMPPGASATQPPPAQPEKRIRAMILGIVAAVIVIAVIAVALGNRLAPTSTDGGTNPPGATKEWREVARFTGSNDKTTDSFFIGGEKFRVNWTATAENEFGLLSLYVYKVGQSLWLESVFVSWNAAGTKLDTTTKIANGEIYLQIGVANLVGYTITVEEYTDGSNPPPPQTGQWTEVVRFSGSTDKTTDTFTVSGGKFRLKWTATAENEFGLLSLYVYKVGQSLWLESISVSWNAAGTQSDTSVVFNNGEVYIEIGAANLSSYEIIVEQYA